MTTTDIPQGGGGWLGLLAARPIFGGERGYQSEGDVLVNKTADGIKLEVMWRELMDVVGLYNEERSALARLLSYPTVAVGDSVPQSITSETFEQSSEWGVPRSIGSDKALVLGYSFTDYDLAQRFTWRYLRDVTSEQLQGQFGRVLEGDNKLVNTAILKRLFDPTEGLNDWNHKVYGLWNGSDGLTPTPYLGKQFQSTHSHYIPTEAAQIDSQDIEDAIRLITEHGYGRRPGSKIQILANGNDGEHIQSWRAGVASRTGGPEAKYSFIPSAAAPPYILDGTLVGSAAPDSFEGLPVAGSYGPAWLIESEFIPSGYVAVVATGGPDSLDNVVAVRQHPNVAYQGLRIIPGNQQRYPLVDAMAVRSFGVGTRHRGAAVALQVTTDTTYTAPTFS